MNLEALMLCMSANQCLGGRSKQTRQTRLSIFGRTAVLVGVLSGLFYSTDRAFGRDVSTDFGRAWPSGWHDAQGATRHNDRTRLVDRSAARELHESDEVEVLYCEVMSRELGRSSGDGMSFCPTLMAHSPH